MARLKATGVLLVLLIGIGLAVFAYDTGCYQVYGGAGCFDDEGSYTAYCWHEVVWERYEMPGWNPLDIEVTVFAKCKYVSLYPTLSCSDLDVEDGSGTVGAEAYCVIYYTWFGYCRTSGCWTSCEEE